MITIHVKKRYGTSTVHSCVTAPSIEEALKLTREGPRVVFPITSMRSSPPPIYPYPPECVEGEV
jgi:hypothetical protein